MPVTDDELAEGKPGIIRMQVFEEGALWRKSSYSGAVSNCVEVAVTVDVVGVRDTKDRDGGMLAFSTDRWAAFLHTLR